MSVELIKFLQYEKDLSIDSIAEIIGDSPERLKRVLEGSADLGKTAELALIAVVNNLDPIDRD